MKNTIFQFRFGTISFEAVITGTETDLNFIARVRDFIFLILALTKLEIRLKEIYMPFQQKDWQILHLISY